MSFERAIVLQAGYHWAMDDETKKGGLLGSRQVYVAENTSALADRTALMYLITSIRLMNSGRRGFNICRDA